MKTKQNRTVQDIDREWSNIASEMVHFNKIKPSERLEKLINNRINIVEPKAFFKILKKK